MFPTNCKEESKWPRSGKLASHLASGVVTASLQLASTDESIYCSGSKTIENTPDPFVVALDTTFPPHCSCTPASEILQCICICIYVYVYVYVRVEIS